MVVTVDLAPRNVSALLSGNSKIYKKLRLDKSTPTQRIAALALAYAIVLLVVTSIEKSLFPQGRSALDVALLKDPWTPGAALSFPLLHDPVSILAIVSAFFTPFICLRQSQAMEDMVAVHRNNIAYRDTDVDWYAVNRATSRANRQFKWIGSRLGSIVSLLMAMVLVLPLLSLVRSKGLLSGLRPETVNDIEWHRAVFDGWWANSFSSRPLSAVMIDVAGVTLYYFVVKQLALGAAFTSWIKGITLAGFGTFENLAFNNDGFWGMRVIRRLFQWTYTSAILHLTLSLLVIALWLPVGRVTIIIALFIITADALFVLYPTMTTLRGVETERRAYVRRLYDSNASDRDEAIKAVWQRPMLPFRLSASFSAVFVYFLIPTTVAILSSRLGK